MNKSAAQKIVLGISGSIAAYKACEIVRLLIKDKKSVRVMMTKAAQEFITPLSLQALSGHTVATDLMSLTQESQMGHIQLADWADLILLAPASADLIARMALGLSDDIVTTVLLATKAPIMVAPAMNVNMWSHPATQKNVQTLRDRGVLFVEPEEGDLACGWQGKGRLAEPLTIAQAVSEFSVIK